MATVLVMGPTTWVSEQNAVTVVSNISTSNTAGIVVPRGFGGEVAHLAVAKWNTCTLKIWGYANALNKWHQLDTISFSEVDNEAALVRGVAGYDRVQSSVNAIGSNSISISWGFTGGV